MADGMAMEGAEKRAEVLQVTEGGIRQKVKNWRKEARQVERFRKGKVMSWAWKAATNYFQLRTIQGALQAWRFQIGKAEVSECRHCSKVAETGDHLVFACGKWEEFRKESRKKPRRGSGGIGKILIAAAESSRRRMQRESSLYETWLLSLCQRSGYAVGVDNR